MAVRAAFERVDLRFLFGNFLFQLGDFFLQPLEKSLSGWIGRRIQPWTRGWDQTGRLTGTFEE